MVIGHSSGSLLAVELAAGEQAVVGAVLLATTTKTGGEILAWQARQISERVVPRPAKALLKLFRTSVVKQQANAVAKLKATTGDTARIQLAKVKAKWMREFIAYDPTVALGRTDIPLLAITGSKDIQVDPADLSTVAAVAPDARVDLVEDVDHIMRTEPRPFSNPRRYAKQVKQPIDPRVLSAVLAFLEVVRSTVQEDVATSSPV